MKILYVGNFGPSHSTENHLAQTFEKLGHEVIRTQENGYSPETLTERINEVKPNLFFFTRTWGETVKEHHLQQLRSLGILSVSYHLDLYVGLQRNGGIDTDPFWRTDLVFTPDGDPASDVVFREKGINHVYQWPGVFEDETYIADVPLTHDIIFVGSYNYHPEWTYRQRLIDWLRHTYRHHFELFGNQPDRSRRGAALNELYSGSKITVGDTLCLNFTHPEYWSDRVFETTGRGGFIIHPYIKGLENCFELGTELVTYEYGNFKQLAELIVYYHKNDEKREEIRRAGHARTKRDHTYTQRLTRLLNIVEVTQEALHG